MMEMLTLSNTKINMLNTLAVLKRLWMIRRRYPASYWIKALGPLMTYLPFAFLTSYLSRVNHAEISTEVQLYIFTGVVVFSVITNNLSDIGFSILQEKQMGTLSLNFMVSSSLHPLMNGALLYSMIFQLINIGLFSFLGFFFFQGHINIDFSHLTLSLILLFFFSSQLSFLYSYFLLHAKERGTVHRILTGGLIPMMCGMTFSVHLFPQEIYFISQMIPMTHLLDIVRYSLIESDISEAQYWCKIIYLLICILVLRIGNHKLYKIMIRKVMRNGDWEKI